MAPIVCEDVPPAIHAQPWWVGRLLRPHAARPSPLSTCGIVARPTTGGSRHPHLPIKCWHFPPARRHVPLKHGYFLIKLGHFSIQVAPPPATPWAGPYPGPIPSAPPPVSSPATPPTIPAAFPPTRPAAFSPPRPAAFPPTRPLGYSARLRTPRAPRARLRAHLRAGCCAAAQPRARATASGSPTNQTTPVYTHPLSVTTLRSQRRPADPARRTAPFCSHPALPFRSHPQPPSVHSANRYDAEAARKGRRVRPGSAPIRNPSWSKHSRQNSQTEGTADHSARKSRRETRASPGQTLPPKLPRGPC